MEVPILGIRKADPEKRRHVYCISHSRWNDGFSSQARHDFFTFNKRSVVESGVNWVQIQEGFYDPIHIEWLHDRWAFRLNDRDVPGDRPHIEESTLFTPAELDRADDYDRFVRWDFVASELVLLEGVGVEAHAEAEIAYLELFHTCTPAFMKRYQQERKLEEGYHRVRRHVYQLYPLVNHFHLFGTQYLAPLAQAAAASASMEKTAVGRTMGRPLSSPSRGRVHVSAW